MGWRRIPPYLAGASGVALITAAIGVAGRWVDTPTLTVAYVVLVIYMGARAGRLPALATALLSFAVYEFFFVPPYGSLTISAPRDAVSLVVLLAAAAISERVVSALVVRTIGAEAKARESQSLYEVALTALQESEPVAALEVLCARASQEPGISSMTILGEVDGSPLAVVAGEPAVAGELSQAAWTVAHDTSQGLRVETDRLEVFQQFPRQPAYLRLPGGVAVIRTEDRGPSPEGSRVLAALVAMAGLLLDRRRGNLQEARARALEESGRVKATVLSALAHEVKTPLASLRAGLSAMELDRRLADDQRHQLTGLETETARLDRIVHNVLTMTRLDEGLTGERSPVDLAEVVGSSISSLERLLETFQLTVRVPEDLPPVLGDEVQLDRVFANLLENAAHWTVAGGRIEIGARTAHGMVEAWVQNEGPEIPPPALSDIFASYWSARPKGSGLGLAICRRIVETHGGTIAVRNTRTGPRFTVQLPVAEPVGARK
jgi:two-component system sensor histidine kinase KdpD